MILKQGSTVSLEGTPKGTSARFLELRPLAGAGHSEDTVTYSTSLVAAGTRAPNGVFLDLRPFITVAREAIEALLDGRDFLGYQLAHEQGILDEEAFNEIAEQYLHPGAAIPVTEQLARKVACLALLIPDRIDADVVSAAFRCEFDVAVAALNSAENWLAGRAQSPAPEQPLESQGTRGRQG